MNCSPAINTINDTFAEIRNASFTQKKQPLSYEEKVNEFLDRILKLKSDLNERSEIVENIVEKMEGLTWLNNIDDDCLKSLNDLISSARELHHVLIRQFVNLNEIRKQGIAKDESSRFKSCIDDLRDIVNDLDSVFFSLPNIDGFTETTKELSLI